MGLACRATEHWEHIHVGEPTTSAARESSTSTAACGKKLWGRRWEGEAVTQARAVGGRRWWGPVASGGRRERRRALLHSLGHRKETTVVVTCHPSQIRLRLPPDPPPDPHPARHLLGSPPCGSPPRLRLRLAPDPHPARHLRLRLRLARIAAVRIAVVRHRFAPPAALSRQLACGRARGLAVGPVAPGLGERRGGRARPAQWRRTVSSQRGGLAPTCERLGPDWSFAGSQSVRAEEQRAGESRDREDAPGLEHSDPAQILVRLGSESSGGDPAKVPKAPPGPPSQPHRQLTPPRMATVVGRPCHRRSALVEEYGLRRR
ncbi:uncharacterized protein LOC110437196 [Sorghum bicolor]|uniref:uncharacterized protein LOC110437196 n=1 Tax=Sorghum bicolor TaxID=4558 RepID=UPI000B42522B|nr:uncharacterized protein LOC110437196 [Sorghum bicolor]|eukprot:XP_021321222.1 uncharacterized protein LOC110437196 [Sorghum bicolor]